MLTRGAALLEITVTLAALMAGAEGFSRWQAAGAMAATTSVAPMRSESQAASVTRDATRTVPVAGVARNDRGGAW
ncbi:hypothetical protein [Pandoraea pulmonicola]|uniref:Uncharacterized protein n=1 Tax=Pandoraea pulmonicola TaxID=93221 RepID=A0AAJ5D238_PANPU|nr:hypothetical protein [Pandoraea pulmonicola]AJC19518.1 hypothetical protein RO07_01690 [Pandoraea pulmonicola]SUA92423.1 Uncharacterised protein [Pandoraea pulmonicola]